MRRLFSFATLAVASFACSFASLSAQAQLGVGARALGMGGAFTAVADDASAPYWNPAGQALQRGFHVALPNINARLTGPITASDLFDHFPSSTQGQLNFLQRAGTGVTRADASGFVSLGTTHFAISFLPFATGTVTPSSPGSPGSFVYTNLAGQQIPVAGSQAVLNANVAFQTAFTLASKTDKQTAAGLNLKVINYQPTMVVATYNGTNVGNSGTINTTTGAVTVAFAADAGVLYKATPKLTLGATLRNFIRPNAGNFLPTRLSLGAAYRSTKRHLLLAADLDEIGSAGQSRLNLGVEYAPHRYFAARAGLYRGLPTLGVGIGPYVNVAYGPNNTLLGIALGF